MSSPAVAGAIALWLEADPTLTSAEVADIIRRTADTSTAGYKADPAPWGAGRFDALAGLRAVLEGAGTALPATDNRLILRHQDGGWTVTTAGGAAVEATLADLHGRILGQGTQLRCPGPGLYIIKAGATAFKAIAK